MDARTKVGVTSEGLPCAVTLYFAPDAADGSMPERVSGLYQASDGPGAFSIVLDGACYRDVDSGVTHEQAHALLPWVVAEGDW